MSKPIRYPLWNGLCAHQQNNPISFHVPGHRNGKLFNIANTISNGQLTHIEALKRLAQLDLTELSGTDDLHDPSGIIANAQNEAAQYFGAEHTFFLVGGSTSGNLAIILTLCQRGDYIIVQRNVHKSIINGCKLAGVHVVFVAPLLDEETGYSYIPSLNTIEKALTQYPNAKAVILTNPNYYGMSVDLTDYVKLIHCYHIPLVVDEAHGAHYGLHPALPSSALQAGADAVIQSTHKTLPALTMSAMLHIQHNRVSKKRLQQQLAMLESSSPSYLLMASLDLARGLMQENGKALIEQSLYYRARLEQWLVEQNSPIQFIKAITQHAQSETTAVTQKMEKNNVVRFDPFRIILYDRTGQRTGYELQALLAQHQIWAEMATMEHVILVFHLGYTEQEFATLTSRLTTLANELQQTKLQLVTADDYGYNENQLVEQIENSFAAYQEWPVISEPVWMDRALYEDVQEVLLKDAIDERSAEMIIPYPPGIPIIYEGEVISAAVIQQIEQLLHSGARFQGSEYLTSGKIKILMR